MYTVRFSPYFEGLLNTSGTGHIRFWKVASTFTGLKLQGQVHWQGWEKGTGKAGRKESRR